MLKNADVRRYSVKKNDAACAFHIAKCANYTGCVGKTEAPSLICENIAQRGSIGTSSIRGMPRTDLTLKPESHSTELGQSRSRLKVKMAVAVP